jgi:hypothetical protein
MQIITLDTAKPHSPRMGRRPHQPTPKSRKKVRDLAGLGLRQYVIGIALELSARSLRRHYRKELDLGSAFAQRNVLQSLYDMAISRRSAAATIFWAKTRAGFTQTSEKPPKDRNRSKYPPKSLAPKPKRQSSLTGLTAELNDGAPNGDF